MMLSKEKQ